MFSIKLKIIKLICSKSDTIYSYYEKNYPEYLI